MSITKYFTKEGRIAGLAITDAALRLVLLEKKIKAGIKLTAYREEKLSEGDVVGGKVVNRQNFTRSVKALLKKTRSKINYAVISLPADESFARIASFPPTLRGEKLVDSIKLMADFQMPEKPDKIFVDWQLGPDPEKNEALLCSINRDVADPAIDSLAEAGLRVVALEIAELSAARAVRNEPEPLLALSKNGGAIVISTIQNNFLRLLHVINAPGADARFVGAEVEKIAKYSDSLDRPVKNLAVIGDWPPGLGGKLPLKQSPAPLVDIAGLESLGAIEPWLPALGAALRGLIPRENDNLISLMRVGTEAAYKQEKAIVFTRVLSRFTVAFSIFLTAAFFATWLLMQKVQANFNQQIKNYIAMPITADANLLEKKAGDFNSLVALTLGYYQSEVRWLPVIDELKSIGSSTVALTSVSLVAPDQPITLTGSALSRPDLNDFKQSLEQSALFRDVNLPLENLEKKNNIPFRITMFIENPADLYPKNP